VGIEQDVGADLVDDPVVGGTQLEDAGAQLRAGGDGLDGPLQELATSLIRIGWPPQ
jgi:hypothetical protein